MTGKTGIIYLQKDKFQFYSPYSLNGFEFRFVPELIRDYDLISRELLENLLKVFIANNKIPASNLIIIVADNASFIKDFVLTASPDRTLEALRDQANEYLNHVPFEDVAKKTFPLATGVRAYATNQTIYEGIKNVLEKFGFIVHMVLPGFIFGPLLNQKSSLDNGVIITILQQLNNVKEYNLLKNDSILLDTSLPQAKEEMPSEQASHIASFENKKVVLAVGISVLVIIFAVTGGLLYWQFTTPPYKPPPAQQQSVAPQPTQQTPIVPRAVSNQELTVRIVHTATLVASAQTLQTAFVKYGLQSVTLQVQDNPGAHKPLIVFSQRVSTQIKTSVIDEVKKIFGDILVQEKADTTIDIRITLGQ